MKAKEAEEEKRDEIWELWFEAKVVEVGVKEEDSSVFWKRRSTISFFFSVSFSLLTRNDNFDFFSLSLTKMSNFSNATY